MHTAMWLIPIAPFIVAISTTWSLREAIRETVWFNVGYVLTLLVIYMADVFGYGYISTSPTGPGAGLGMAVGFGALAVARYRWKKEQYAKAVARAEEQRRLAAERKRQGITTAPARDDSLVIHAFRFAGTMERTRRQMLAKRRADNQSTAADQ